MSERARELISEEVNAIAIEDSAGVEVVGPILERMEKSYWQGKKML
jgi:hypothetical protein